MADLAELGITVDTSGLKEAARELDKFNANIGGATPAAMDRVEAASKRAGISIEEFRRRTASTAAEMENFARKSSASERASERFERNASKAQKEMTALQVATQGISSAVGRLATVLIATFAAQYSVDNIRRAIDEVAKIGDLAERTGITTRELQTFRTVVSQNGGTIGDADRALTMFSKHLGEAGTTTNYLSRLFAANGIQLNLKNTGESMSKAMDLMARLPDHATRMRVAMKLFGDEAGPKLAQLAGQGTAAIRSMNEEANRLGQSEGAIAKARALDAEFKKLEESAGNAFKTLSISLGPTLLSALKSVAEFIERMGRGLDFIYATAAQRGAAVVNVLKHGSDMGSARNRIMFGRGESMSADDAAGFYGAIPSAAGEKASRAGPTKDVPTRELQDRADAYDRLEKSIEKQIAALKAEAATIGMGTREVQAHRIEQQLLLAAEQSNLQQSPDLLAAIKGKAAAYGLAAEAAERAKLAGEIRFETAKIGLSDEDVRIAERLRTLYGDDVPGALKTNDATPMRLEAAISGKRAEKSNSEAKPKVDDERLQRSLAAAA